MRIKFFHLLILLGLIYLSTLSHAVDKTTKIQCDLVSKSQSDIAFKNGEFYKEFNKLNDIEKNEIKDLMNKMFEASDNKNYKVWKLMEKNPQKNDAYYEKYIAQYRFAYEYAKSIAEKFPGKTKLSYEGMIYGECMNIAMKSDNEFENSPLQIERRKEIAKLEHELKKPKEQIQQIQKIVINPVSPVNCTSMPDGPGSKRLITTCF